MSTAQSPLRPIPKVYIPALAALVVILLSSIASGDFARAELAALLTTIGYFVLGYLVPTDGVGTRSGIPAGEAGRTEDPRFSNRPLE